MDEMATRLKTFKVMTHGRTDVGLIRDNNEDAWLVEAPENVFVLCDGMGGHSAGEVASQEAALTFSNLVKSTLTKNKKIPFKKKPEILKELIQEVNASIYHLGQKERELKGMGTTLCCLYFHHSTMIVGHVGDSRVYLLRDGELKQLTEDHSLVAELLELGELNKRQARDCSYRNIITRAIGVQPSVDPSIQVREMIAGDQVLMCSDGLSDMLALDEIESILNHSSTVENAVDRLISTANQKGGRDNITAVIVKLS